MFKRLWPIIGTLLVSRATRRIAGRNAALVALALGAFELLRNYQRTSAPAQTQANADKTKRASRSSSRPSHRRRKRPI